MREELWLHVLVARRSFFGPEDRLDLDLSGLNGQISHADEVISSGAKMKTQPTLKMPRCRTFRNSAIVLSHPKHSSTFTLPLRDPFVGSLRVSIRFHYKRASHGINRRLPEYSPSELPFMSVSAIFQLLAASRASTRTATHRGPVELTLHRPIWR